MNPQTVSTAFKAALAAWATTNGVQVFDYVPDSWNPPCVAIYPETIPYDRTAGARWVLVCVTGSVETQGAQARLQSWLAETGTTSIVAVIDANHSLSGAVSSVLPLEVRRYGMMPTQDGRPRLLQAELVCDILR